jgi:CMP-N,N'-diacetyllegionaminic acid synthase
MFIGLIPARSGSKGLLGKNIKLLGGYPLISYSIIASRLSRKINRTIVTTDSEEYAELSIRYGAEVPFLRPLDISQDNSDAIEYVKHTLTWLDDNEGKSPDNLVLLCPPSPLRDPFVIDNAITAFLKNPMATSLRSVSETQESPYKLFTITNDYLTGMFPNDSRPEYYNLPRQSFPKVYHPNGYIDIIRKGIVNSTTSLNGNFMMPFISPFGGDIDREEDFEYTEYLLRKTSNPIYEYLKNNY